MSCFCFLRNVVDLLKSGQTAWEKRFKTKFTGPNLPLGAEITYKPITDKDKARLHKFGDKTLPGLFVGYSQQAGGYWSGDLLVVDKEELESIELLTELHIKRFNAKEIFAKTLDNGDFQFPLATGEWAQPEMKSAEQRLSLIHI